MKKTNYLLLALSLSLSAFKLPAQSLERFVIGSAGLSSQNENIQLSFTVGEPVVSNFQTDELQLNQGFQQTNVEEVTTGIELPTYIQDIMVYPNPVGTTLYLDINATKALEFLAEVYDLSGKSQAFFVLPFRIAGLSRYQIDLAGLVSGIYVLMIKTNEGVPVKVFKIQKM